MEVKQIATSNPHEYKGMFSINELSSSEKLSSIMSIGELKFRIKHRTTNKGILEFDICFLENQKWINTGKNCRDIHTNLSLNTDMHTRVILKNNTNENIWYSMSEFDVLRSNLGVTNEKFQNLRRDCATIPLTNASAILSIALDENCIKRNPFASLYSDTLLTDFELRCENGSIPVHKVVLAIASPVLKTFLESENNWLENRWYKFSDTDVSTLQHLKDYVHLDVLPDEGLENLLLVASCYMMEELKHECISKLLPKVKPENALEISEFAVAHRVSELFIGFLKKVQDGTIKVDEIQINQPKTKALPHSQNKVNATTQTLQEVQNTAETSKKNAP